MVAHIKSQRLVAFIIYSSLSIYASTGKKRIHYSNVVDRERNQSEIQNFYDVVVAWEDFCEEEEGEKKSCFWVSCCFLAAFTKKECFFSFEAYL